jgi:hypothetical protein
MSTDKLLSVEGNKTIAEFMSKKTPSNRIDKYWLTVPGKDLKHWIDAYDLKYHSSWDWLMPVLKKIKEVNSTLDADEVRFIIFELSLFDDISDVWLATLQFIQWYNLYITELVENFKKYGLP